jgi:hypothetical protein
VQDGITASRKAIELNPKSWKAHFSMAIAYRQQGLRKDGLRELGIAFRLSPTKVTGFPLLIEYISVNNIWFVISLIILFLVAIAIHSPFALLLMMIPSTYIFILSYAWLRAKKYRKFIVGVLMGVILIAIYFYYLYALPPLLANY